MGTTEPGTGERPRRAAVVAPAVVLLAAVGAGCGGGPAPGEPVEVGWVEEGVASWYGPAFHGRPTASGEIFDMEGLTAAHRTLPLGTRIRVENLENGRELVVRVNDRGPFVDGRILDVSRAAARRLGFLRQGTARIRYVIVDVPDCFEVQIASLARRENVRALRRRLEGAGEPHRTEDAPGGLTRVLAGPYDTYRKANGVRRRFGGEVRSC